VSTISGSETILSTVPKVQRVCRELKCGPVRVAQVPVLNPPVRAITFGGEWQAGVLTQSFDQRLKLFPFTDGNALVWRDHAPQLAATAVPCRQAVIGGPRRSSVIAPGRDGVLLLGDDSALPVIAHQPDRMPAGPPAIMLPNAPDADGRPRLASSADLRLKWFGDQADPTRALRAGVVAAMALVTHKPLDNKRHGRQPIRAAACRKHGATTHHNNLEN
jgi:NADPH-dependent ferric siderophore reductase